MNGWRDLVIFVSVEVAASMWQQHVGCLMMVSIEATGSIGYGMINEYGAVEGMRIDNGNVSAQRKSHFVHHTSHVA
jgi:hypothetical protein